MYVKPKTFRSKMKSWLYLVLFYDYGLMKVGALLWMCDTLPVCFVFV